MKKKKKLKFSKRAQFEYDQIQEDIKIAWAFVRKARYRKAYDHAKKTLARYPDNRFAVYKYAVALGDSREWTSAATHLKNQRKAAALLKKLLNRTRGIDPRWVKVIRNEYYWFSKQPYKQYRLGIDHVSKDGNGSFYSAGVGAVSIAILRHKAGKVAQANVWAQKAISAWQGYFEADANYYNSYVWYAKALGLSGDEKAMEAALKKAAKLAKRPLNYQEFRRARETVRECLDSSPN